MKRKLRVAVLFGGRSAEHEVSLQSAKSIIETIDKDKYEVILIGINKQGQWFLNSASNLVLNTHDPRLIKLNGSGSCVTLVPGAKENKLVSLAAHEDSQPIDVVFPVLHGPYGEDGTIQGLLKLADIPFVGPGVLGSAVGMDKDVLKRLLRDAGIPIAKFLVLQRAQKDKVKFDEIAQELGLPMFIKPANLGSSVGVSKVCSESKFAAAVEEAFKYDQKIIIEEFIAGREIECSVLGNADPIASVPGEVIPQHEFYSYEAKYIDEKGAVLEIPAKLPEHTIKEIQKLAVKTFQTLCCEGMARVDCFLKGNGQVIVNEINTIPGFTKISMYPKLWEASGISYKELLDRLIQLALDRFQAEQQLQTSRQ
ncbi:MAG: D-alanine--D-alanine ligase [Candidatus Melainabacteria bacterium]|nr:D-alanine--D-alanine ligase [Candidatus Melainabacteria bacterium]